MSRSLEKIASDDAVRLIAGLAGEFGIKAYLAGGGVRDCLLGRRVKDLDFALSGASAELPRLFAERWGGTFFWLDEERLQARSEEHTSELQSRGHLVCRLLLVKKKDLPQLVHVQLDVNCDSISKLQRCSQ